MDSIIARGMTFQACHGTMPVEKNNRQTFKVDLEMYLDLKKAGQTDDLQHTVNYAQAFRLVEQVVTGTSYDLIEALADKIAGTLLSAFPVLQRVVVTVFKPEAPVQGEFSYFAVKIERFQQK